ncbi:CRISPR system Cascade subunit CasA [Haloferula luteola]|uniref:CRISPR system Cascade subunit CasA n=1 Tax=Haloferula luteola TaxID=595692 RepID=A0A840V895_9BACT|nr:type I-E CRISPR-associated protein Cse1/CasA [Haloferula luteola]MBB5350958.1 CRISPR system Cascade subunit CasA [Haloferula luteola]
MTPFNLIDQPWIPVRWLPSSETRRPPQISLCEAFALSEKIADIDGAPHERIALMRLLVCITHAALGAPLDADEWGDFGSDLEIAVPAYLHHPTIHPRFHLLGPDPRFLQKKPKSLDPKDGYPLSKSAFHLSSGNNSKLLDHWGEAPRPWTPSAAALLVLCLQNFFVGGSMASKVKGNGPALKSLQMLLKGDSLRDSILRNALDLETIERTGGHLGKPVWEGPPDHNLLARLAPISCALWLSDDLQTLFIDQGHSYLEFEAYRDPFASIEIIKDGKNEKRRLLRAKPDQGIWRDLHLLTNLTHSVGSDAALNLQCFNARKNLGETTDLWVGELIKAKDAKIEDATESTFTIPQALFGEAGQHLYAAGIDHAEAVSKFLYGAIKTYGKSLSHENPPILEGKKQFWHQLDQNHRTLIEMAGKPQPGQAEIGSHDAKDPWTLLVRAAAIRAFKSVCPHTTPRQIQAHSAGARVLRKALYPKPPGATKNATPSQT